MKGFMKRKSSVMAMGLMASVVLAGKVGAISGMNTTKIAITDGMTMDVILANDQVHSDESASTMIDNSVIAAINGGFFDSYYNPGATITFPDNSPRIYGALIQDGELINGGGNNNFIGFTYDGKILVERVKCEPTLILNNEKTVTAWSVNQSYSASTAICIMTDDFNMSFATAPTSKVFTVVNNVVTEVSSATSHTVADGSFKVVFNSGAVESSTKWNTLP